MNALEKFIQLAGLDEAATLNVLQIRGGVAAEKSACKIPRLRGKSGRRLKVFPVAAGINLCQTKTN